MILVTGAGGKTGRTLIQTLSKAERVRALVHRDEHIPLLKDLGAENVIVGDMRSSAAIRSAIEGVRAVYHICPNMSSDEVAIGRLVLESARESGVEHFVYHSVLHPQTEKMDHHWQKLRVEELIFESGLPFTILQPAPYMQNLLAGWNSIVENGVLHVPYSVESRFSFVDLEDIAQAATIILTQPGHRYATYELAGTGPTSPVDVARVFGRMLYREVRVEQEGMGDWRRRAKDLSEYAIENLVKMFEYYDRWGLTGNPNILKWILGREPASLEAFVARTVGGNDGRKASPTTQ